MCWTLDADDGVWETCKAQCKAWLLSATQEDLFPPRWVGDPSRGSEASKSALQPKTTEGDLPWHEDPA